MDVSKSSKKEVLATRFDNCDAPGSWYCPGSYPKAFQNQITLAGRKAFKQLEDFNTERTKVKYRCPTPVKLCFFKE